MDLKEYRRLKYERGNKKYAENAQTIYLALLVTEKDANKKHLWRYLKSFDFANLPTKQLNGAFALLTYRKQAEIKTRGGVTFVRTMPKPL